MRSDEGAGAYRALIFDAAGRPTWRYDAAFFRAEVERLGVELAELERRVGWSAGWASRVLGYRPHRSRRRDGSLPYRTAVQLARALGLHPVEVGV